MSAERAPETRTSGRHDDGRRADVEPTIGNLRRELDGIDAEIVRLIAQRLATVAGIAAAKERSTSRVRDPDRERLVLNQVEEEAVRLGVSPSFVRGLFSAIIEHSVSLQAARIEDGELGGLSRVSEFSIRYFE